MFPKACGAFTIYIEASYRTNVFAHRTTLMPFITSMFSLTLANSVLTTC